ncbi:hypothetical protein KZ829_39120 [Actinoplanes hulinensis]|uniref:Uncharacterized protein n=1 Tax=Actinoplanes hulinensis TaxID=1144547 RepID=A0ABS7BFT1_9ACTN|nr:hypothetical protein [Actinoplanes hulinensis]MBW6439757.1 hypothetical protein [Actinoplanes hulinensis]
MALGVLVLFLFITLASMAGKVAFLAEGLADLITAKIFSPLLRREAERGREANSRYRPGMAPYRARPGPVRDKRCGQGRCGQVDRTVFMGGGADASRV